jgi:hypothetical protein
MNYEDMEILKEYLRNCEKQRNVCLYRNQMLAFAYYQGMCDIIAQICVDEEILNPDSHKDVT